MCLQAITAAVPLEPKHLRAIEDLPGPLPKHPFEQNLQPQENDS